MKATRQSPDLGSTLVCAETGKTFIAARDGCSVNYAHSPTGEIVSDEGVDIREKRELLDRSQPFTCYLSSDTRHVTGWKGNVLGTVTGYVERRTGFHGSTQAFFRVTDVHGGLWAARGPGPGMYCTLRPIKGKN